MMADLEGRLSETLRLLMTRTGQRQEDVARVLGLTRATLSQRLLGHARWRVGDLPLLAEHFGLTVVELISGYAAIPPDRLPPSRTDPGQTRI